MEYSDIANEFIEQALSRMDEDLSKCKKCIHLLLDEEIWRKPNEASNSIGNQLLHLSGNITQYILSSLGGLNDTRERDKEFSAHGGLTKAELYNLFESTVLNAIEVIQSFDIEQMMQKRYVQGFEFTAIGIILHVVEHFSYHTGQIVFWTKFLKDKDMGFYANINLNHHNKS